VEFAGVECRKSGGPPSRASLKYRTEKNYMEASWVQGSGGYSVRGSTREKKKNLHLETNTKGGEEGIKVWGGSKYVDKKVRNLRKVARKAKKGMGGSCMYEEGEVGEGRFGKTN